MQLTYSANSQTLMSVCWEICTLIAIPNYTLYVINYHDIDNNYLFSINLDLIECRTSLAGSKYLWLPAKPYLLYSQALRRIQLKLNPSLYSLKQISLSDIML